MTCEHPKDCNECYDKITKLEDALRRAHDCATLNDDGTCGGCFVSEALVVEKENAPPKCAICGKPATCSGVYEIGEKREFACDDCCGHGNEDGHCEPVEKENAPPAEQRHAFVGMCDAPVGNQCTIFGLCHHRIKGILCGKPASDLIHHIVNVEGNCTVFGYNSRHIGNS